MKVHLRPLKSSREKAYDNTLYSQVNKTKVDSRKDFQVPDIARPIWPLLVRRQNVLVVQASKDIHSRAANQGKTLYCPTV